MKSFFSLFAIFFIFCLNSLQIETSAPTALLMNLDNGKILFQKNANKKVYPASTIKIATAIYVLEKISDLDHYVVPSEEALKVVSAKTQLTKVPYHLEHDGAMLRELKAGKKYLLKDLLNAFLVGSFNDATNVVAEAMSGSIPKFMDELNAYLKKIGLVNTNLKNPHGLHCIDNYTTAKDLAILGRYAMKNEQFRKIVGQESYFIPFLKKEIYQTNALLRPGKFFYPKAFGIKTGNTEKAGYSLIAAAKDNSRRLLTVVLGCKKRKDRFEETVKLFETAFSEKKIERTFFDTSKVFARKIKNAKKPLIARLKSDVNLSFFPSEWPEIKAHILWEKIALPIRKNQPVGTLVVLADEKEVIRATLIAEKEVKKNLLSKISSFFQVFK